MPGFKSLLLRQTEWTDEFYSSVHSFFVFQLNTLMVIKVDIIVNHFIGLFKSLWFVSVDALGFQDAKEIFSQRIVTAISTP